MGRTGDPIDLIISDDAHDFEKVREEILQFFANFWDGLLTKKQADETWDWVSMGIDSLIKLEMDEDGLTIWYNRVPGWPIRLGHHRVRAALVAGWDELSEMLARHGYTIKEKRPSKSWALEYAEDCQCGLCEVLNKPEASVEAKDDPADPDELQDILEFERRDGAVGYQALLKLILDFLGRRWDRILPTGHADETCAWLSTGEITIEGDETLLNIWYKPGPGWSWRLGRHRLRAALVEGRQQLEALLASSGYGLLTVPSLEAALELEGCNCNLCKKLR